VDDRIGPLRGHDAGRGAVAYVCDVDEFATPLGKIAVDREMVGKLMAFNPGIKSDRAIHAHEHSVEIQLPFLQVLNRTCKIVPVLFGTPTVGNCKIMADAIAAAAGARKVFVLASTDMSHYPPYDASARLDQSTLEVMRSMNVEKLFAHLDTQEASGVVPNLQTAMCSRGGVGTAMFFAKARGADAAEILGYANSGDAPVGDRNGVVGYGSAVFVKREPSAQR
jgi:AmmeMemoRadiSam system protein B